MSYFIQPKNYNPILNLQQTELGITKIKDFFQANLSAELRLRRVTAPLFVLRGTGLLQTRTVFWGLMATFYCGILSLKFQLKFRQWVYV